MGRWHWPELEGMLMFYECSYLVSFLDHSFVAYDDVPHTNYRRWRFSHLYDYRPIDRPVARIKEDIRKYWHTENPGCRVVILDIKRRMHLHG